LECLDEAARGLVEGFADVGDALATDTVPVVFDTAPDGEEAVLAVLEEIIYLVNVLGVVAVDTALEETEDGGMAGYFETAPAARVDRVGAAPQGVSRSGLEFRADDGQWRCRAVIDV
jgi:SHS2 domain-containing protein